ncbi:DNA-binding protein [Proteus terrae]|uniref:DNA-binding protein n=1 Tax=Proteus terrae TaxID=1574161 RepID=UPI00217CF087|nr:DNA-binding protein [Proteus terrae]MCS6715155.1 DNA-binding protein [Proteus terrae]MCS6733130.1 DNA-binding protein [Proteus terrae]
MMIKHTTAEREINTSAKLNEYQLNLLKRINNLAISLLPEFEDKNQAMNAITLDDDSLMQLLYTVQLEQKTRVNDYELRKVRRRRENLEKFYRELKELGGTLKVNDVADILGITRQAVNVRVKKNKLLAFKQNGGFIFPKFQFSDHGLIPGFEDIMVAFEEDTHPMLRLGVLKSPIEVNTEGLQKTPIQIMQDGAKKSELSLAIRAVKQFGNHVAS